MGESGESTYNDQGTNKKDIGKEVTRTTEPARVPLEPCADSPY